MDYARKSTRPIDRAVFDTAVEIHDPEARREFLPKPVAVMNSGLPASWAGWMPGISRRVFSGPRPLPGWRPVAMWWRRSEAGCPERGGGNRSCSV